MRQLVLLAAACALAPAVVVADEDHPQHAIIAPWQYPDVKPHRSDYSGFTLPQGYDGRLSSWQEIADSVDDIFQHYATKIQATFPDIAKPGFSSGKPGDLKWALHSTGPADQPHARYLLLVQQQNLFTIVKVTPNGKNWMLHVECNSFARQ